MTRKQTNGTKWAIGAYEPEQIQLSFHRLRAIQTEVPEHVLVISVLLGRVDHDSKQRIFETYMDVKKRFDHACR